MFSGTYLRAVPKGPESQHGITLQFEDVLSDLVEIWSKACGRTFDREHARGLISRYFPVALPIKKHEQMASIFERARELISFHE
jgi:hypothetical protein